MTALARSLPRERKHMHWRLNKTALVTLTLCSITNLWAQTPTVGCTDDNWTTLTAANPPSARRSHTAVWTGNEMIVWGGYFAGTVANGRRYNPATNNWVATSTTNEPAARYLHTGIWTGTEMIVWGGLDSGASNFNTG